MDNISRTLTLPVFHVKDVHTLKQNIERLKDFSDGQVEKLYSQYSDLFCESWLELDHKTISDFSRWVNE